MRNALILLLILFLFLSVWASVFNEGKPYDFEEGYKMLMGKLQNSGEFAQDMFKLFGGDFSIIGKWLNKIGEAIINFAKDIWDSLWGRTKTETNTETTAYFTETEITHDTVNTIRTFKFARV